MKIRNFAVGDYSAIVDIDSSLNIVWPERPRTPEAWAVADQNRNPKRKFQRLVAVTDRKVVGFGSYVQISRDHHPRRFHINVEVSPNYQRQGIGAALYDRIMAELQPLEPRVLRADAFTNLPQGFLFLQKRGFYEAFRETPVHLDVTSFDPSPYVELEAKLLDKGMVIKTLRDLKTDPNRDRKIYDLYWEVQEDVPREDLQIEKQCFDEWVKWGLNDPVILHDAYCVAIHGDRYIGLSEWGTEPDSDAVVGGLAGVRRTHRKQGIGLALHLRGIAYARKHGYRVLKTCTAVHNLPMQALFNRLGFARDPEWLQCQKDMSESLAVAS
jgi:GNAT superfamily N-acetyltransferase